jgi:hypothetical protein
MDFEFSSAFTQNGSKRARLTTPARDEKRPFDFQLENNDANQPSDFGCPATKSIRLPIDWSIKTRVRFISKVAFPWNGQFKAIEDAAGLTAFVRCMQTPIEKCRLKSGGNSASNLIGLEAQQLLSPRLSSLGVGEVKVNAVEPIDSSQTAVLRKFGFVWMYPNFPWMPLFPRIENTCNVSGAVTDKQEILFKDAKSPMCEQLRHEWCVSVRSLYNLLKSKHCPYFYVCDNSFTILFRAAGVAGIDNIHALISNSSSGLRKMLKEEGIDFTMPLMDPADLEADDFTFNELKGETVEDSG